MKINYFVGARSNFGDALNPWMWPKIIPDFFDEDDRVVFLGIGSIIGEKTYGPHIRKIVFGAGFVPEYHKTSDVRGPNWDIFFVRGPRTAKMLKISPQLALGDPAILLRTLVKPRARAPGVISFMPHWESLGRGRWEEACRLAGVNLIDPRAPVETVLDELLRSKTVIAESMHGAIVADALRIPWIPVTPTNPPHRNKWLDWSDSLGIKLQRQRLWPSSLLEARLSFLRKPISESRFSGRIEAGLVHAAAHRLRRLSRVSPSLSDERMLDLAIEKMLGKVAGLRKTYG